MDWTRVLIVPLVIAFFIVIGMFVNGLYFTQVEKNLIYLSMFLLVAFYMLYSLYRR